MTRLWEKAYHSARHQAAAGGHGKIFAKAEAAAIAYSQTLDTGGPSLAPRLQHALFDRLVYAKLRAAAERWSTRNANPGHRKRGKRP